MKLVYIHGLGGLPSSPVAERVSRELGAEVLYLDYSYISEDRGWTENILSLLREQIPGDSHILMGHSFGALLSLYLQSPSTRALVLISPAVSLNIGVRLTIQADVMRKGTFYYEAMRPVEMDKADVKRFFHMIREAPRPRAPFIVVVGSEDHLLDVNGVLKFFRKCGSRDGTYVEMSHADHSLKGREGEVADIVLAFLKNVVKDIK